MSRCTLECLTRGTCAATSLRVGLASMEIPVCFSTCWIQQLCPPPRALPNAASPLATQAQLGSGNQVGWLAPALNAQFILFPPPKVELWDQEGMAASHPAHQQSWSRCEGQTIARGGEGTVDTKQLQIVRLHDTLLAVGGSAMALFTTPLPLATFACQGA